MDKKKSKKGRGERPYPLPDLKGFFELGALSAWGHGQVEVGEGDEEQDGVGVLDYLGPTTALSLLPAHVDDLEELLLELHTRI